MKGFVQAKYSIALLSFLISSCKTFYTPQRVEYSYYQITAQDNRDDGVTKLMQPYRDSVAKSINEVIATAEKDMQLLQPWGTINNFFADALLFSAQRKYDRNIDAAIANIGGIRLMQLKKGSVTKGEIYELMPFENMLVLVQVRGEVLQQLLNIVALQNGWPVAGISMQIKDKKAASISIKNEPLVADKVYTIATSDYVANGGENAVMLKDLPKQDSGYLVRDAVFDYIKAMNNKVSATEEKRIINVD